ncbi:MAG: hypothetical protein GC149_06090 [Gammaproteobacteria bacterium]|nr:hypothetical protein [Gammaproteobacteria bacterium]
MVKHVIPVSLLCAFALFAGGCGGGNMLDVQSPFSTASQNATLDSVTRTIITASAFKGWKPAIAGAGHIIATRRHSGRMAKVDITFDTASFNITYLDSDNMQYDGKSISSVYHQWVDGLRDEIKTRLSQL